MPSRNLTSSCWWLEGPRPKRGMMGVPPRALRGRLPIDMRQTHGPEYFHRTPLARNRPAADLRGPGRLRAVRDPDGGFGGGGAARRPRGAPWSRLGAAVPQGRPSYRRVGASAARRGTCFPLFFRRRPGAPLPPHTPRAGHSRPGRALSFGGRPCSRPKVTADASTGSTSTSARPPGRTVRTGTGCESTPLSERPPPAARAVFGGPRARRAARGLVARCGYG